MWLVDRRVKGNPCETSWSWLLVLSCTALMISERLNLVLKDLSHMCNFVNLTFQELDFLGAQKIQNCLRMTYALCNQGSYQRCA